MARFAINLVGTLVRHIGWKPKPFVALGAVEALIVVPGSSHILPFRVVAAFLAARADPRHSSNKYKLCPDRKSVV